MKFLDKQDKEVSYNFGIHPIHRKHPNGHENTATTEIILAANVQQMKQCFPLFY
jgi:hypothetical protein